MPKKKVDTSLPKPPKTVAEILKQKKKEIGIIVNSEDEEDGGGVPNLERKPVEEVVEENLDAKTEIKEVIEKPRQKAHLAKAREKALQVRQEKAEKMKFLEEYYLKNEKALAVKEKNRKLYTPKNKKRPPTPIPSPQQSEDEESSEEEVVYVKPKKKVIRKVVVEEEEDDDDEAEYYRRQQQYQQPIYAPQPQQYRDPNRIYTLKDFF